MSRMAAVGLMIAAGLAPAPPEPRGQAGPDFKVAYWFRIDDIPGTLKSRAYDLRKGEEPGTLAAWLRSMHDDHPEYGAFVRDVYLEDLPGGTEREKLATAIDREYQDIRTVHSYVDPQRLLRTPRPSRPSRRAGGSAVATYPRGEPPGTSPPRHFPGEYRGSDHGSWQPAPSPAGGIPPAPYLFTPNPILR